MDIDYSKMTIRQIEICNRLRKLRLSAMANELAMQFSNPNTELTPFIDRIDAIVGSETQLRADNKFQKLLRNATLKYPSASFDERLRRPDRMIDLQFIDRLCECSWVRDAKILSITGATGTGKSHIACALGICAMQKGYTVKYFFTSTLINELMKASATNTIVEYLNWVCAFDLLIIDDFGYSDEGQTKKKPLNYHRLFQILNTTEKHKATIIAAQIPRPDWYDLFRNDTYADACMDRIVKGNLLLELTGASQRG